MTPKKTRPHPARYSAQLLPHFARLLAGTTRVLDPFAGTGERLLAICPQACLNEIQYKWACATPRGVVGNALHLPYPAGYFEVAITSVTYGNRMADRFVDRQPDKHYKRHTYTHYYGVRLHEDNSGQMQWGRAYRRLHHAAMREIIRVLQPGGLYILNVSDHIRNKRRVPVARFHRLLAQVMGLRLRETLAVATPRQRHGENGQARVACEYIYVFVKE